MPRLSPDLLPQSINCPHCAVKMDLDDNERKAKKFACPGCGKDIDFSHPVEEPALSQSDSNPSQDSAPSSTSVKGDESRQVRSNQSTGKPAPPSPASKNPWLGVLACLVFPFLAAPYMWLANKSTKETRIVVTIWAALMLLGMALSPRESSNQLASSGGLASNGFAYSLLQNGTHQNAKSLDATIHVDYTIGKNSALVAAQEVCGLIWDVAQWHKASTSVDVTVYVDKEKLDLIDQYGQKKTGIVKITDIMTDNLSEVRKYTRDAYQGQTLSGASKVIVVVHDIVGYDRANWFSDGDKYSY